MDSHLVSTLPRSLGQYFSENLSAVLAIGGKQREDGKPGLLRRPSYSVKQESLAAR